ncbi:MAG: VWA domain-containing protein [Fibrobacter sp.]|nr:VWA domain-containing protein [Fibrobacter sp.]
MKMKRLNEMAKKLSIHFILVLIVFVNADSAQICELYLNTCPENLHNDTIYVPDSIVALSANVLSCKLEDVVEGVEGSAGPPSIFFIIDHSHSMTGLGAVYPGNDPYGKRFEVTMDLIDTVYAKHPDAEIGLVVFREVLYFDHRNNPLFEPLSGQGDQSYLPLQELNRRYGGNTGIDNIRSVLQIDTLPGENPYVDRGNTIEFEYVDLVYKPEFRTQGNTNINSAFDAALAALENASNPPERQFIIFLSDGEPHPTNTQHGGKEPYYFTEGNNTPATFTVYLSNSETQPPQSLLTMTNNVKTNGYSASNPSSDIWVTNTEDYSALMDLFMTRIIKPILVISSGTPKVLSVNGVISTRTEQNDFIFSNRFPLSDDVTEFRIDIDYSMKNTSTGAVSDTQTNTVFHVVRKKDAIVPDYMVEICWNTDDLAFYYDGKPVTQISETMEFLEVRFVSADDKRKSVNIEISHTEADIPDRFNISLSKNGSYWSKEFKREIGKAVQNDKILQHAVNDSIVAVYRNPDNPLDTIRISVPFSLSKTVSFSSASYWDTDADGFIDSIFLGINGSVTKNDLGVIADNLDLPKYRNFKIVDLKIVSGGLAWIVEELRDVPQTSTNSNDVISVSQIILPGGGMIQTGSLQIIDRVAPVIISARLVIGAMEKDSLSVQFSENVNEISSVRPFKFSKPDGDVYEVTLEADGILNDDQYSTLVQNVQNGFDIELNDSIWINTIASVTDKSTNSQKNPANRRVLIFMKQMVYSVIPGATNNPFVPEAVIPEPVRRVYENAGKAPPSNGMVIFIEPEEKLRSNIILTGKISIYDVVKNPVLRDHPMVFDKESGRLLFIWDGRNSKKRKTGTGTYVAHCTFEDNQGFSETKILRIGIKR